MNLVNKIVTHKRYGEGSVVKINDSYITVNFKVGKKKFLFPDAFESYLTLKDENAAETVNKVLEERIREIEQQEKEIEEERARKYKEHQRLLERERLLKNLKINPESQAVFWCKDDEIDKVFTDWKVFTGVTKSGENIGQPKKLSRLNQNSACLITARESGESESKRRILGLFMVKEEFVGKLCEDGMIEAHPDFRIRLTAEESEKMLFWNYYINKRNPESIIWNSGKYRYFNNIWLAQILKDIAALRNDAKENEYVNEFLDYYCSMNKIKKNEIPKPSGALLNK